MSVMGRYAVNITFTLEFSGSLVCIDLREPIKLKIVLHREVTRNALPCQICFDQCMDMGLGLVLQNW